MSEKLEMQADLIGMEPIITQYCRDVNAQLENNILLSVEKAVGFHVHKGRLLQALTDARAFYEEGYRAAMRESEWISVKDRLPEYGLRVLAAHDDGVVRIGISKGYFPAVVTKRQDTKAFGFAEVTHWMPLPEPPKEG